MEVPQFQQSVDISEHHERKALNDANFKVLMPSRSLTSRNLTAFSILQPKKECYESGSSIYEYVEDSNQGEEFDYLEGEEFLNIRHNNSPFNRDMEHEVIAFRLLNEVKEDVCLINHKPSDFNIEMKKFPKVTLKAFRMIQIDISSGHRLGNCT